MKAIKHWTHSYFDFSCGANKIISKKKKKIKWKINEKINK